MSRIDESRLMVRVTRMYYERGMRQPEIAEHLGISQAKIYTCTLNAKSSSSFNK